MVSDVSVNDGGMGMSGVLVRTESGPYDRWVALKNPARMPFVQPRENVPTESEDGSHHLGWKLCLSAKSRDRYGDSEFAYWHEHYLWARNEADALDAANWLLKRNPALLDFQ